MSLPELDNAIITAWRAELERLYAIRDNTTQALAAARAELVEIDRQHALAFAAETEKGIIDRAAVAARAAEREQAVMLVDHLGQQLQRQAQTAAQHGSSYPAAHARAHRPRVLYGISEAVAAEAELRTAEAALAAAHRRNTAAMDAIKSAHGEGYPLPIPLRPNPNMMWGGVKYPERLNEEQARLLFGADAAEALDGGQ